MELCPNCNLPMGRIGYTTEMWICDYCGTQVIYDRSGIN